MDFWVTNHYIIITLLFVSDDNMAIVGRYAVTKAAVEHPLMGQYKSLKTELNAIDKVGWGVWMWMLGGGGGGCGDVGM